MKDLAKEMVYTQSNRFRDWQFVGRFRSIQLNPWPVLDMCQTGKSCPWTRFLRFNRKLWLAEWFALTAKQEDGLKQAQNILEGVAEHALPSGILAEQLDPYTGQPISVNPLTWSHAA